MRMELDPEQEYLGTKVGADENEGLESPSFPRFLIERSTLSGRSGVRVTSRTLVNRDWEVPVLSCFPTEKFESVLPSILLLDQNAKLFII